MRAAVHRIDVIGEAEHLVGVTIVVLQRNLHGQSAIGDFALALDINRLFVQNLLRAIEMLNKLGNAAFVQKLIRPNRILPLVSKNNPEALIQEGELTQPLGQRVVVKLGNFHDGGVRFERDLSARLLGAAHFAQRVLRNAAFVILLPGGFVAPNFQVQGLGQRIHATYSDAVQTA